MDRKRALMLAAGSVVAGAGFVLLKLLKRRRIKKARSVWAKNSSPRPQEGGGGSNMLQDVSELCNLLRMTTENFDELHSFVAGDISKANTHMRDAISSKERLCVTLYFLATGKSYKSLMSSTKIHHSTISMFIPTVCQSIYNNLKSRGYIELPQTEVEWKAIANKFQQMWNYPLCLGAIDAKHIAFRPPSSAGPYYFNYKGFHSLVLMAVVDSEYKFIFADAGVNDRIGEGVLRSTFFKSLDQGKLNLPQNVPLPGREEPIPYHFIGNDGFSSSTNVMQPYPLSNLPPDEAIFNERLMQARSVAENAFGILSTRFRILLTTINLAPEKVELVILACVALHNFLAMKNTRHYLDTDNLESTLTGLAPVTGHSISPAAKITRDELTQYFSQNPL